MADMVMLIVVLLVMAAILGGAVWLGRHHNSRVARGIAAGGQKYNSMIGLGGEPRPRHRPDFHHAQPKD